MDVLGAVLGAVDGPGIDVLRAVLGAVDGPGMDVLGAALGAAACESDFGVVGVAGVGATLGDAGV